ncbi:MAG: hypothetical protein HY286_14075 [Planctomycetes bacterium]|nr:hypothetical protein [Planctomycetota bacterium]
MGLSNTGFRGFLAKAALPAAVARTARRIEMQYSADERAVAGELRAAGAGLELDLRIVAGALAKVRGLEFRDAMARARAGCMLAIADGSIGADPGLREITQAAWRGDLAARQK